VEAVKPVKPQRKRSRRDVFRYEAWLRIRDVYPDLTFGEFLKNGCAPWNVRDPLRQSEQAFSRAEGRS